MNQILKGVKVLDFTTAIAGSYGVRLIADLGADVIKVEPLGGEPFRSQIGNFIVWNSSKRSIMINLRDTKGQEIIHRVVRNVDIVAENYRPGTTKRLGIDYDTLSAINPGLIYSTETGWGDSGPYGNRPAYDPVLQAESGIMANQGHGQETPMDLSHAEVDIPTAGLHGFAIMSAFYTKLKTGQGQHVKTSLMGGALSVQPSTFIFYENKPDPPTAGKGYLGPSATTHFYKTLDKWLYIEVEGDSNWKKLCFAIQSFNLLKDKRFDSITKRYANRNLLADILSDIFRNKPSAHWQKSLEGAGLICSPVNNSTDMPNDPQVIAQYRLAKYYQPLVSGEVTQFKTIFQLSETPSVISQSAPLPGEHTEQILIEYDYTKEQIKEYKEQGIVA